MSNTTTITDIRPADTVPTQQPYVLQRDEGEHLHFLNHLATPKVTAGDDGAMTTVEFVAPCGFGPPLHVHDSEDEVIIVLDGEISCRAGDVEGVARAGATIYLPHGVPHTFQVMSETARFVAVSASKAGRPVFDQVVRTLGAPTDEPVLPEPGEIDPGEVARVCRDHGIDVLGPPPATLD